MTIRKDRWQRILPSWFRWQSGLGGPHQPVNSYAWVRDHRVILIDPPADLTPEGLRGIGTHPVSDIFITHLQEEHAAGCFHFPDARVHVPAGDEYLSRGLAAYEACITNWPPPWDWSTRGWYRGHLAGARNERPLQQPLLLDEPLVAGMTVSDFRVIATPGHGKSAITLIAEIGGQRVGFCGDLVFSDGMLWNWFDCDWDYGHQTGQNCLLQSAQRLQQEQLDFLYPAHGEVILNPHAALARLCERLTTVLHPSPLLGATPINFSEKESRARGFREILPGLHQWRDGNCNVLLSRTGNALMVDDGLCYWKPLPERKAHHREVMAELKRELGIHRIEMVVPTHYHGDHTENIPDLVALEHCEVVCLDFLVESIEHPERFNLAAQLPWYGTNQGSFKVDRKLPDGARLRWHEYEIEFFHLGGQTHYHLGLATDIQGLRTLFVGDAIHYCGPLVDPVYCFNQADPATAGWLYATEKMLDRKPDLLVCGHGSSIRNPMPLLERRRNAWKQRLEEFRALSARADLREFFDPFHERN